MTAARSLSLTSKKAQLDDNILNWKHYKYCDRNFDIKYYVHLEAAMSFTWWSGRTGDKCLPRKSFRGPVIWKDAHWRDRWERRSGKDKNAHQQDWKAKKTTRRGQKVQLGAWKTWDNPLGLTATKKTGLAFVGNDKPRGSVWGDTCEFFERLVCKQGNQEADRPTKRLLLTVLTRNDKSLTILLDHGLLSTSYTFAWTLRASFY